MKKALSGTGALVLALSLSSGAAWADEPEPDSASVMTAAGTPFVLFSEDIETTPQADESILMESSDMTITAETGSAWREGLDGGAYLLDEEGDYLLTVSAPTVSTDQEATTTRWIISDNTLVADADGHSDAQLTTYAGAVLVKSVKKSSEKGKPRYLITPTKVGRATPSAIHAKTGWAQAKRKGVDRPTKGLFEQYVCHPMSQVARVKSTWNIESWRPTVGMARTVAARCNPS